MPCKDAEPDDVKHRNRPTPFPGPRCYTCHHVRKRSLKRRGRETSANRLYGLTPERLAALKANQRRNADGKPLCAICPRVVGTVKNPAIDHDHRTGRVRGLLCSVCNRYLGHIGDDPMTGLRMTLYLLYPPADEVP